MIQLQVYDIELSLQKSQDLCKCEHLTKVMTSNVHLELIKLTKKFIFYFWAFSNIQMKEVECGLQLTANIAKHQKIQYHIQQWADIASSIWIQMKGKIFYTLSS